jgi:hypothetical protein
MLDYTLLQSIMKQDASLKHLAHGKGFWQSSQSTQ